MTTNETPAGDEMANHSGNQKTCSVISTYKVGRMWSHVRSGGCFWLRTFFASLALLGILAARNAPFHFPQSSGNHFRAYSQHDQRPRFNDNGPRWTAPLATLSPVLPVIETARLNPRCERFSTPPAKGSHYNRPPPLA